MAFEILCTDVNYIAFVLDGAKAQYVSLPDELKQGVTLEEFQAQEVLSRCLKRENAAPVSRGGVSLRARN